MTNISRKGVWAIVLGALAAATLIFFAWATSGFRNWDAASWFDYWGKGKAVRVAEPAAEQHAAALQSSNAGLTYDSDEVTYAVIKYGAPQLHLTSNDENESILLFLSHHYSAYAHGTKLKVEILSLSDTVLKTYEHTYSAAAPAQVNGTCFDGTFTLSVSQIKAVTTEKFIKVRACNIGDGTGLDSNVVTKTVYIGDITYSCDGTTLTIPKVKIGEYTVPFQIHAVDSGLSFNALTDARDIIVDANYSLSRGDFHYADLNSNSPAIKENTNAYTVELTKLSFAAQVKDVNSIYINLPSYGQFSSGTVTYNGTNIDTAMFSYTPFRFSISQLATPQNVTFVNGKLTWDTVEGAQGYGVFEGDENHWTVEASEFDLTDKEFGDGETTIRIRALGNVGKALETSSVMTISAYNAAINITQLVTLTYNVEGDVITKFVPHGSKMSGYTYDVTVPGKEFGGWYYDSGFSRPVVSTDTIGGDMTIFARLSDKKVAEAQTSWWDSYKWYVVAAIAVVVVGGIIAGVVITRKKKAD